MSDVLQGDGVGADGKPLFMATRYVRRETEVLALRIETDEQVAKFGGKVGDYLVTDDRGQRFVMPQDEFHYYYNEYEGASWPGKITIQLGNNLSAHGCKALYLNGYEAKDSAGKARTIDVLINEWAEKQENFGKLISVVNYFDQYSAVIFYTNTLTDRERAEIQEVSVETRRTIDARHKEALENQAEAMNKALEAEKAAKEKAAAEAAEYERLIELGRKHEQNCKKARN